MSFFGRLVGAVKGVMMRMGLIQSINNVTEFAAVQESERQYNRIIAWKALYHGYLPRYAGRPFHEVDVTTIGSKKNFHRRLATMDMAKIASEQMASLIFNNKCLINISSKDKPQFQGNGTTAGQSPPGAKQINQSNQSKALNDDAGTTSDQTDTDAPDEFGKNVMDILTDNHFYQLEQNYIEYGLAEGGHLVKVNFDGDKIKLAFVTADNFLPTQSSNGHIDAGVFLSQTMKGQYFYTLLEWHQWEGTTYKIINELYQSMSQNDIGTKVPLSILYPDMQPEIDIPNLEHPLFAYIKPNLSNNFETHSPLGISIFANCIDTLKSLDIAFDSFQREFVLGKRRIIVPQTALKTVIDPIDGKPHRYFDVNDEVYQAMALGNMDTQQIQEMASTLRVTDHVAAINSLLEILAMQMGFSAHTFSFAGSGRSSSVIQTATQVISENSQTFRTKCSHETLEEQGIKEVVDAIAALAKAYSLFDVPDDYDVTVQFDDSVAEDKTAMAANNITQVNAGLLSKITAMMRINGWTREQAEEELEQIQKETSAGQPDITSIFGQVEHPSPSLDTTNNGHLTEKPNAAGQNNHGNFAGNHGQVPKPGAPGGNSRSGV